MLRQERDLGTLSSIGVQPPWPSSPLDARPQVNRAPLEAMAALWEDPQATATALISGPSDPGPSRRAMAPRTLAFS